MRYFTKDYVIKKRCLSSLDGYLPIPDQKTYSEEDISNYYQQRLEERILKAKKDFDTPLKPLESREDIISSYDEKKYPMYDLVSQRIIGYHSLESVLKSYDDQVLRQKELFEKRGQFNPEKIINSFKWDYEYELEKKSNIPEVFLSRIDKRLLALHYIPESIYQEIDEFIKKARNEVLIIDTMNKDCLKVEIPALIQENFISPRVEIIAMNQEGDNLSFLFFFPGIVKAGFTAYREISFQEVSILNREDGLPFNVEFHRVKNYPESVKVLYYEIYPCLKGYETHLLFESKNSKLLELVFTFKDYKIELNY